MDHQKTFVMRKFFVVISYVFFYDFQISVFLACQHRARVVEQVLNFIIPSQDIKERVHVLFYSRIGCPPIRGVKPVGS